MTSARLIVGLSILSLCIGGFALLLSVGPASAVIPPFVSVNSLEGLVTVGGSSPISVSTVGQTITVSCSTCATGSGFVTSLDSLTGALTLAHFSSLNMTTVGNTITLGINLANPNTWSATQNFTKSIGVDSINGIATSSALVWTPAKLSYVIFDNWRGTAAPEISLGAGEGSDLAVYYSPGSTYGFTVYGAASAANEVFQTGTNYIETYYHMILGINPFYFTSGSTNVFGLSSTGIGNTQGFQQMHSYALGGASTSTVATMPVAEPDTNYIAICTMTNAGGSALSPIYISPTSTTTFTASYTLIGAPGGLMNCIVTHQ